MVKKENHPQLSMLKAMWNYPDEVLNKVLWANTPNDPDERQRAIGDAQHYLDFMESVVETDKPEDAWEQFCIIYKIEHEIENNPYL